MGLAETIKKAALDAMLASNPVQVLFGEVVTESPLAIRVDQRFILPVEFLVLTETVSSKLSKGARVVLLRIQGGQQFLVLDRLVSS